MTSTETPKTDRYFLVLAILASLTIAASSLAQMAKPAEAAFPGENGSVFYSSTRDGDGEIYRASLSILAKKKLTDNSTSDREPTASPDGEKIAFVSNRDGNPEIYVMNADGTNQTRLTYNQDALDLNPTFSPDGTRIAFVSWSTLPGGNAEVYVMDAADGAAQTNLTNNPAGDFQPDFSPDGGKIAFHTNRDGNDEVYVMDSGGTGTPTNLTNNPAEDGLPDFSPDGKQIAFDSNRAGPAQGNVEIYMMDSDGTQVNRLTNSAGPGYQDLDINPVFSPDGTRIAFTSHRDGNYEIYTMSVKGAHLKNLTKHPAGDTDPDWGPQPN